MLDLNAETTFLAVYDGDCGLCAKSVLFILKHDIRKRYLFTPIQSPLGAHICTLAGINPDDPSSFIAIVGGRRYTKGLAVLSVTTSLGGAWLMLWPFKILPTSLLNWIYDLVAKRRKSLFSSAKQCLADPSLKSRLILTNEPSQTS